MSITKDSGRQDVACAIVPFTYADFASGVFQAAIELPLGAIVIGGAVAITTAFNSATTDLLDVGISTSTEKYGANFNVHATGSFPLTGLAQKEANQIDMGLTWTGTGAAPTAGVGSLVVMYAKAKKVEWSQG